MVENFGSYLRHERELRGVALAEISRATRIHIRFLKALENNSFEELPSEVFVKGYIRSYANNIGSDAEELLNLYKETMDIKNQEKDSVKTPKTPKTLFPGIQPKTILKPGLLILVVASFFFGVGVLVKKGNDSEQVKVSSTQKQAESAIAEPSISSGFSENQIVEESVEGLGEEKILPLNQLVELDAQTSSTLPADSGSQNSEGLGEEKILSTDQLVELDAQTSSTLPADSGSQNSEGLGEEKILSTDQLVELDPQASNTLPTDSGSQNSEDVEKPLRLTILAKKNSWFNITIDKSREEDFIFTAGTVKTFWGDNVFRLTVGDKAGVELLLNGKALTLPENEDGEVRDFIIDSKLLE